MNKTWIITWRDFKSNFTSPIGYIFITAFLGLLGYMFFFNLYHFSLQNLQYQQYNMGKGVSISDGIVKPLFGNMNVLMFIIMPFLTMRLFAEEKKNHSIELLLTAPVTTTQMVLGKFLSAVMVLALMLLLTLFYPIVLAIAGNPDPGPIVGGYMGTILMGASFIAIGVFCSAVTENQIVAASLSFGLILFFWLISWASQSAGPVVGDILNNLSLISHYNNFSRGLLDSSDAVFYLSFIGFWLFLAHRVLESYRWR
ncbi:MAG TPA: ABC transporter permease subunit [Bdellovibrionota bacterium]|nr:ABC transporter permease subunit [Bdellovibrionota bacterium]